MTPPSLRESGQARLTLELTLCPVSQAKDFTPRHPEFLHEVIYADTFLTHSVDVGLFASQIESLEVAHNLIYDRQGQLSVKGKA